jgi:hypothetical protein
MKCFNAFTGETTDCPTTPTLHSLRNPAKYWVISDAQLKRDLKGRTIKDVYRENRAGREACNGKYVPRWETESANGGGLDQTVRSYGGKPVVPSLCEEYLAECKARNHTPHPASIDSDHPLNCHREKMPRRDIDFVLSVPLKEAA